MAAKIINGIGEILALANQEIGRSEWLEITQERVNAFADATLDHQWIHIDAERAKAESPFKTPIAHGYLTLSLLAYLLDQVIEVKGVKMVINYGLNKLRYPTPVPVGSRLRLALAFGGVEEIKGGVQVSMLTTVELDGSPKPAAVAEVLFRYYA